MTSKREMDIEYEIKRVRYYLDLLSHDREGFEYRDNIIDLEYHTHNLAKMMGSDTHHKKRGYISGYIPPVLENGS
jgi:hypothetical protein